MTIRAQLNKYALQIRLVKASLVLSVLFFSLRPFLLKGDALIDLIIPLAIFWYGVNWFLRYRSPIIWFRRRFLNYRHSTVQWLIGWVDFIALTFVLTYVAISYDTLLLPLMLLYALPLYRVAGDHRHPSMLRFILPAILLTVISRLLQVITKDPSTIVPQDMVVDTLLILILVTLPFMLLYLTKVSDVHKLGAKIFGLSPLGYWDAIDRVAEVALQHTRADICVLYALEDGTVVGPPTVKMARGVRLREPRHLETQTSIAETSSVHVVLNHYRTAGRPYYRQDVRSDELYRGGLNYTGHPSFVEREGVQSSVGVALSSDMVDADRVFGVMWLNYREQQRFDPTFEVLIETISRAAAAELANAQLRSEVAAKQARLARLEALDGMHGRVKINLQSAFPLLCQLESHLKVGAASTINSGAADPDPPRVEQFERVATLIQDAIAELDLIEAGKTGYAISPLSLQSTLVRWWDSERRYRPSLPKLTFVGWENVRELPARTEVVTRLYHVIRQLLWNCVEHARASHVTVELLARADGVLVTVSDNGVGCRRNEVLGPRGGLALLREQIHSLGGELEILAVRGKGVTATVVMPRGEVQEWLTRQQSAGSS